VQQVFWMLLVEQETGESDGQEGKSATTEATSSIEAARREVKAIAGGFAQRIDLDRCEFSDSQDLYNEGYPHPLYTSSDRARSRPPRTQS
jgi:hypothetical protein